MHGYDDNAGPDYGNLMISILLVWCPRLMDMETWFEIWVTDLHINSTDPGSPYYFTSASPYNDWPLNNNGNSPKALHSEE